MYFQHFQIDLKNFLSLRNNFFSKKIIHDDGYIWYLGFDVAGKALQKLQNEANTRPLQKLTCLSVFKLLTRYLSSEHSKHILRASRSPIFDWTLSFFEKQIFVLSTTPNEHFGKEILTKLGFEGSKKLKKIIFFNLFKMLLGSIYMSTIRSLGALRYLKHDLLSL